MHGYAPIRGLAGRARRSQRAIATSTASSRSRDRGGDHSRHEDRRSSSLHSRSADEGDDLAAPGPVLPRLSIGPALAGARIATFRCVREHGWTPDLDAAPTASALFLNYPSNPCAVCAPDGVFDDAVAWARRTGGAVVHDAAYVDIVFDGRRRKLPLGRRRKDVGVEMWSMSKTYGMAGWRIGFVVGNAEIVERINMFNDHPASASSRHCNSHRRGSRRAAGFGRRACRRLRAAPRPDRGRSSRTHPCAKEPSTCGFACPRA